MFYCESSERWCCVTCINDHRRAKHYNQNFFRPLKREVDTKAAGLLGTLKVYGILYITNHHFEGTINSKEEKNLQPNKN